MSGPRRSVPGGDDSRTQPFPSGVRILSQVVMIVMWLAGAGRAATMFSADCRQRVSDPVGIISRLALGQSQQMVISR